MEGHVELDDRLDFLSDPAAILSEFLDQTPNALAIYRPDGRCERVNRAYVELFGISPHECTDLADDEVLGRSGVLFWLRRAFSGETITTPTFWYDRARPGQGRRRVALSARAFPLRQRSGAIELVAVVFRDETDELLLAERRRADAEEPLRLLDEIQRADLERHTNEEQFRAVFEQCADGVMLTDDQGRVLDINPSGCRIFGRRVQDIVGSRYWEHIGDVAESRPLSEQLLEHGRLTAQVRVRRADGELRELELRGVANFLPHRHLTTFLDVTDRNRALRELQRSEAHLIASQRIAHVGSWEFELTGSLDELDSNVLRCSDECYRIFGFEPGSVDVTPRAALHFVHPDDRDGFVTAMREALRTGKSCSSEHRIVRPDGTVRMVHARGELVRDRSGKLPLRVAGTTQDVTDRTSAREEIERLNADLERRVAERTAQLEAANQDLESFAYSASHDLRAPLRAINGYAQILLGEEHAALGEEAQRALLRIEQSARRMDGLIDGLLALSRLGRRAPEIEHVDVDRIVKEAIDELGLADTPGVVLSIGGLPPCHADASLLRQLFVNLLGNAAKFSRGRKPAVIGVDCRLVGGERIWSVHDNGIGFEMDLAPRLFGVFQRLQTAEPYEGTGLGLAIVDRIVKRHGGRIWVDAAPNEGATFFFTLNPKIPGG